MKPITAYGGRWSVRRATVYGELGLSSLLWRDITSKGLTEAPVDEARWLGAIQMAELMNKSDRHLNRYCAGKGH